MKIKWPSFFRLFCKSLLNQVEHTWLSSTFRFVSMSGLEFFLLIGILIQYSNMVELKKFLEKNQGLHI
jgi:hypothetical protein